MACRHARAATASLTFPLVPPRILVTGSRDWEDWSVIEDALIDALTDFPGATLVHGACPSGADDIADKIWLSWYDGERLERHPAQWRKHDGGCPQWHVGKSVCKRAGFRRNGEMVDLGADVVLAFRKNGSTGTSDTIQKAGDAGLLVRVFDQ